MATLPTTAPLGWRGRCSVAGVGIRSTLIKKSAGPALTGLAGPVSHEAGTTTRMASTATDPLGPPVEPWGDPAFETTADGGPTPAALLERAAQLGPPLTWESFAVQPDPVVRAKMEAPVVERRAKLRRVVKATVGGCAAVCVIAAVVTAVADAHADSPRIAASARTSLDRTATASPGAPSGRVVDVEKLDDTKRSKASKGAKLDPPAPRAPARALKVKRR